MAQSVSKLSIPITNIDIYEPNTITGNFVYNFYLPTEDREYNLTPTSPFIAYGHTPTSLQMITATTAAQIEENERGSIRTRVPRYIELQIGRNTSPYDSLPADGIQVSSLQSATRWYGGKNGNLYAHVAAGNYNIEGRVENQYNAAVTMQDASAKSRNQKMIYRISTAKVEQGSMLGETSDLDIAAQIDAMTSEDVDATSIVNMLADDSPLGMTYVNDVSTAIRNPLDEKAAIRYEMKFNVLGYKQVVSPTMQGNPFLANYASDILSAGLRNSEKTITGVTQNPLLDNTLFPPPASSPVILSSGQDVQPSIVTLESLGAQNFPVGPDDTFAITPSVVHIGYLIEKTGISATGAYEEFDNKILLNPDETDFIDVEVKYGYTYVYRARQLYLVHHWIRTGDYFEDGNGDISWDTAEHSYCSYIVASRSPNPLTVKAKETTPPPSPAILHCSFVYSQGKGVRLEWQLPADKTRDIKKYQVFRRASIEEPFTCIAEYDFRDEGYTQFAETENISPELVHKVDFPRYYHIDQDFERESNFIYSIVAVDAHGLSSQLGTQMHAKFDIFTNKLVVKKVSAHGAPKAYPNMLLERHDSKLSKLTEDVATDSNHHTMRVHFNPDIYHYTKDSPIDTLGNNPVAASQESVVLSESQGSYKFQIINLDRQKTKILEVAIKASESLSGIL